MSDAKPHPGRRLTEREFVAWADDKTRAEWVDGEVIVTPPMNEDHDALAFWLRSVVQWFVEGRGLGRVMGPDFTIRLPRHRRRRVPDVLLISQSRVRTSCARTTSKGHPIWPWKSSRARASRDWRDKYLDYQSAGVREYWIIDRSAGRVGLNALVRGKYKEIGATDGKLSSAVLKGFCLRREWLLASRLPPLGGVLKERGVKR